MSLVKIVMIKHHDHSHDLLMNYTTWLIYECLRHQSTTPSYTRILHST